MAAGKMADCHKPRQNFDSGHSATFHQRGQEIAVVLRDPAPPAKSVGTRASMLKGSVMMRPARSTGVERTGQSFDQFRDTSPFDLLTLNFESCSAALATMSRSDGKPSLGARHNLIRQRS